MAIHITEAYALIDARDAAAALERKVPPAVQGALAQVRKNGHTVTLRLTRNGSLRYSVAGAKETNALTFIKRFDRGVYPPKAGPDLAFSDHGSVWLLHRRSSAGEDWVDEHILIDGNEVQFFGSALVVEPRYVGDIALGATNDGLDVEGFTVEGQLK